MCLDLDRTQKATPDFLGEMISKYKKGVCNYSKIFTMGVNGNNEQLVCINHDFVHKSEVNPPHVQLHVNSKSDIF